MVPDARIQFQGAVRALGKRRHARPAVSRCPY
jgi:hypothetical protein